MNRNQVKGRIRVVEGSIKEVLGATVGNERLEFEGNIDVAVGKTEAAYGDLKDALDKK